MSESSGTLNREHDLKTWPGPFAAVWSGVKKHEVRINDRGYVVGDAASAPS